MPGTVHKPLLDVVRDCDYSARCRSNDIVSGVLYLPFIPMAMSTTNDSFQVIDQVDVPEIHGIQDLHEQNMSFSAVQPVDVKVRNLQVQVNISSPILQTVKSWFNRPKVEDVEGQTNTSTNRKTILASVSSDFPVGTLSAIIGGSGSGKVNFFSVPDPRFIDDLSVDDAS
jgi:ABC-type multidrug transport system fused ATPase/permease subunit